HAPARGAAAHGTGRGGRDRAPAPACVEWRHPNRRTAPLPTGQPFRYRVSAESGLIRPALLCASPNQDERPGAGDITLVVLHNISLPPGEFGGPYIEHLFTNCLDRNAHPYFDTICDLQVSAHLLVRRDGSLVQFVPFGRRAWHAGPSCFRGRPRCNDYSIGIELEG